MTKGKARHVIAAIEFPPKQDHGPCECSCGWAGDSSDYAQHRAEVGQNQGHGYQVGHNEHSYGAAPRVLG